ncbi:MAG: transcriptional regulator PpsR, partial [Betaproteobacteria bacterium]|nr:transcriptional regulator PpsR [Betaproteobacteria bacterium]
MNLFDTQHRPLSGVDVSVAASLIAAAADIAVVLDADGVVRDVAVVSDTLKLDGMDTWVGQPWTSVVTVESRPKVAALMRDAAERSTRKWRHINHPTPSGADVPVLYAAVQVGDKGSVVAFGRDYGAAASLQQRLVDAQQAIERDYLRLRHMETRYRLLFQSVGEAVVIVDVATRSIVEINAAASRLLAEPVDKLLGRAFLASFDADSQSSILTLFGGVRAGGRSDEIKVRLAGRKTEVHLSASLFRQEAGSLLLVRLLAGPQARADTPGASPLADVIERVPDGFVVTDMTGRVLSANAAFVDMIQLPVGELVEGQSLNQWLGRAGVDLNVLIANLRQHGSVRLYATTLQGHLGATRDVEISAVAVPDAQMPCLGFSIRDISRRLATDPRSAKELPRTVGQLTELVGRVPLRDIIGETTDVIEQLCIQAALELTKD